MSLHDHFMPPLSRSHPWRGFHSAWAAAIARLLNHGGLPADFYAIPNVDLGGPIEIDVATLHERRQESLSASGDGDLNLWSPPEPSLTATLDFASLDLVEVQVFFDDADPRLVAAVELVSPSNKDRPSARRAFAVKCASYLHQSTSVVIVDAVTPRKANLHQELLRTLELDAAAAWQSPSDLYAVAYCAPTVEDRHELRAWPHALTLGQPLPTLPLWLGADFCVPLDLEASYQATCEDLRIRVAG